MNRRSFLSAFAALPVVAAVQASWFTKPVELSVISINVIDGVLAALTPSLETLFTEWHPFLENMANGRRTWGGKRRTGKQVLFQGEEDDLVAESKVNRVAGQVCTFLRRNP